MGYRLSPLPRLLHRPTEVSKIHNSQRVIEYTLRDFAPESAHRTAAIVRGLANGVPARTGVVAKKLHVSMALGLQRLKRAAVYDLVVKGSKPGEWWPPDAAPKPAGKIVAKR